MQFATGGDSNIKLRKITVLLAVVLGVQSLAAADVEFTCVITGGGDNGFDVYPVNSSSEAEKCSATCTVTKKDGSTQSWTYNATVPGKTTSQRVWFGG
jgi:hypothetical protein